MARALPGLGARMFPGTCSLCAAEAVCAAQMADLQARCEAHLPEVLGGEGVLEQALQCAHGHAEAGAPCLVALLPWLPWLLWQACLAPAPLTSAHLARDSSMPGQMTSPPNGWLCSPACSSCGAHRGRCAPAGAVRRACAAAPGAAAGQRAPCRPAARAPRGPAGRHGRGAAAAAGVPAAHDSPRLAGLRAQQRRLAAALGCAMHT